jgi:DNA-binding transcriptional regulator YdaS (Cro superfamily)
MDMLSALKRAITHFGSQARLAAAIGVRQPSVSGAVRRGRASAALALKIERASKGAIKAAELRPDVFEEAEP